jgi:peptidoglycan/LPS O-acetylase OafA/YrhL
MHLPYRPDIDGLRAFAVTSVVIFHAFPNLIPGGFVGVDVFFVISGFLISGIIFREIESSSFSFLDFYARRIKRIFPALITVLVSAYAFGWFFLFSDDFRRLGAHIFRATLFLSNLLLMREAGYFDNAAETKPLLHLWSLAIEEQFYLAWPLIVWVFWRVKALRFPLIALLTLSSLVWNIYQSQVDLTRDFYSPLTRFWELSAGAWLAFYKMRNPQNDRWADVISFSALALLVAAAYVIDNQRAFPGAWALLPVLGSVLLIYAGPNAWCNKVVFSNPAMVWIGAISYPLYLWHWPILAFARIIEGSTPSVVVRFGAVVLSVLLAWATFVWIEKPIRFAWKSVLRVPLLIGLLVVLSYLGASVKNSGGYPSRPIMQSQIASNEGDVGHEAFHTYYAENFFPCADERVHATSEKWGSLVRCFQTKLNAPIDLVMIGDSHAEHLLIGMSHAYPKLNIAVYLRSDLPFVNSPQYKDIFESVGNDPRIKYVLLTAMWAVAPLPKEASGVFDKNLQATLEFLKSKGKQVILTDDTPKFGFDPQRCKFTHPLSGSTHCSDLKDMYRQTRDSYMFALEAAQLRDPDLVLVRLDDLFCDEQACRMDADGQLFFRDNNHLNIQGSKLVGSAVAGYLRRHPKLALL